MGAWRGDAHQVWRWKIDAGFTADAGVFMVFHGEVLWNFMHQSIADQPRYEDIPLPL
jgi:hypothetical protein